ncbi:MULTISPECIES: hypothetical protein [Paenibacillus]|uniref:Uncharacterized protein n=1 Tax=Paenibacillus lautus TaxID=1401 RepID=A0A1R1B6C2_PAELA|nr:hypothetical protein [Paenibacillus lautus]OME95020.1 hypothetical protein BK123_07975 [Paenibacillus lautus]
MKVKLKRKYADRIALWICSVWMVLVLCSCQSEGEEVEHVEAFIAENIMMNADGFSVPAGYKKVNSITNYEDNRGATQSRVRAIEDYYDSNGNFIITKVYDQSHKRLKNLQTEDTNNLEQELDQPLTIHIPDDQTWKPVQLTDEQKDEIKAHVMKHTKNL